MKKRPHALRWLIEPLEEQRTYFEKPMFGCLAVYFGGRLTLVLADREPPWDGILVPTERDVHQSIMSELPALSPHPVLGKWLYVSQTHEDFEETAGELVELVLGGDMRIGVEPKERAPGKTGKKRKK